MQFLVIGSTTYTCMLNSNGGVAADLTVTVLESGDSSNVMEPKLDGKSKFLKD